MFSASSRPSRRCSRRAARRDGSDRRPLLEALEQRQLLSSASVSWAKVSSAGMPALASAAGDVFTSDGSTLTEFQGSAYGASVPSTGTVMAVDDGHAYTNEVAKYATLGGLHREWAHNNFPSVSGVAAAPDGSVYVTGTFYGSFDADPGADTHMLMAAASGPDAYLVKLDPAGNYVWGQDVGNSYTGGPAVDITVGPRVGADAAGDGYLAVTYANGFRPPFAIGGVHLIKFDPSGNYLWDHLVGTGNAGETKVTSLAVGPSGELAIAGTTDTANLDNLHPHPVDTGYGDLHEPPDTYGSFVARYDATGALTWAHAPKPNSAFSSSPMADDVDISPRGDVVVAVGANDGVASFSLVQRYDSNGTLLEQQAYDASIRSLSLHSFTGIVLSGTFTGTVDFSPGNTTHTLTSPDGVTAGYLVDITDPGGTPARLSGASLGTAGSWNDTGNTFAKAFDDNPATYFDAPTAQAWAGQDFGRATSISYATYVPRAGYEFRMVGGQFQGSNDGSQWTTVATITDAPHPGVANPLYFTAPVTYRYMRYLSPDGGFGNVAELAFYGAGPEAGPPDLPIHPVAAWDGSHVTLNWTDLATNETGYEAQLLGNAGTVAGADRPADANQLYFDNFNTPGTYYVRLRAIGAAGPTDWVNAGSVTIPGAPATGPLTGTPIGTPGSWNNSGNDLTKALDGDASTYFDAPVAQAWVGLDLGSPHQLTEVRFVPRAGFAWRMTGGQFQGSNDASNWTPLATITSEPAGGTFTTLSLSGTYRYVRYLSNAEGFGNVAELQFLGAAASNPPTTPTPIAGTPFGTAGSWDDFGNTYLKALDGDRTTYFDAPVPQAYVGYDFNAPATLTSVTYYPRVGQESRMVGGQFRASNDAVHWTTLATITSVPNNTLANTLDLSGPNTYRYVEYLSPDGGFGNVAELQFFGLIPAVP